MNKNNKSDLQVSIEAAINEVGVTSFEVNDIDYIISEIRKIYVKGLPRVWWLSLKHIKSINRFPDNSGYATIPDYVKDMYGAGYDLSKKVYFVADGDGDGVLLIYQVPLNKICEIIENCEYFEYYVVACDYSWLIVENDHGDIIICKQA